MQSTERSIVVMRQARLDPIVVHNGDALMKVESPDHDVVWRCRAGGLLYFSVSVQRS